ncbi:MAG TPA: TolC family protein [Verrucomicrobiae bacterium]
MKTSFFLFTICCHCTLNPGAAEVFSTETIVRSALTNNLSLQAARLTVAEAEARVSGAGRLSNPALESSFGPNIAGGERTFSVGFNQSFPITSRLRIEKRLSNIHLDIARAEIAEFERSLAFQVRTTAVTLAAITGQQRLIQNQRENSRGLREAVRRGVQSAETSTIDLAQLELEASLLNFRELQLKSLHSELLIELTLLSGSTISSNLDFTSLPFTNLAARGEPLHSRSDLQVARHRTQAAQQHVALVRAQRWHDIEVGVFTGIDRNEDAPNGIETDHVVGVRVAIPLPLWNSGKARVAEASASQVRMEREEFALLARINADIGAARAQFNAANDQLAIVRDDLLPKARDIEGRLSAAQAQGLSTLLEVLRARERRLELESTELNAHRDLHLAHARHLYASGTILIE